MKLLLLHITLLASFLISAPFSYAQNSHSVAPLVIEHDVSARDQIEESVKITNTTDRVLRIFATVNEVTLGQDGGIQTFVPPAAAGTATSVTSWIEIQRGRIEIAPRETIRVPIKIVVGLNAVPGEYYAFVGLPDASKRDEAEALVYQGGVPGVLVRLSIADTSREFLQLEGFSTERFLFDQTAAQMQYVLENTGDLPVTPAGDIIFYSVNGKEIAAVPVPEESALQPQEKRTYTVAIPPEVSFGKHKAFLRLNYGTSQRATLYDTTFFTVVPLAYLIATFLVLLSLSLLLALWYHKRYRHIPLHHETDDIPMYVREGHHRDEKHHDLHLTKRE